MLPLSLDNSGAAAAAFEIRERDAGREILAAAGAPKRVIKGTFSPHSFKLGKSTAGGREEDRPSTTRAAVDRRRGLPDRHRGERRRHSRWKGLLGRWLQRRRRRLRVRRVCLRSGRRTAGRRSRACRSVARRRPGAIIGDRFYVAGGWAGNNADPSPILEIYDPATEYVDDRGREPGAVCGLRRCRARRQALSRRRVPDRLLLRRRYGHVYDPASDFVGLRGTVPGAHIVDVCGAIDALHLLRRGRER